MYSLTFEQFKLLSKKGNLIPLYAEIPADLDTPVSAFCKIATGKNDFLLESVEGGSKWAQYSFLGTKPRAIFRSKGCDVEIIENKKTKIKAKKDALDELKKFLKQFKPVYTNGLPRFFGGAVGYLSFDMVRYFEKLPLKTVDDVHVYDSYFLITDTMLLFDNLRQVIKVVANIYLKDTKNLKKDFKQAEQKIENIISKLKKPFKYPQTKKEKSINLKPIHSQSQFSKIVNKAKKYIKAGDIFQVVLSTRFQTKTDVKPLELYRSIRRLNPSPYMYFLQYEDMAVVGASPEVMVRLEDKKVELRPIAGTRGRGKNEIEDIKLEKELLADPKERAEHVMLVDLGRNDLGRISEIGSVKVDEQEVIERYSHVMHIVSHVSGRLKKGKDAFDVIRATFPAGTLSGAPKIRAMEIIEELEDLRRGIYGGCVGYISFHGNCDTAITIRTALFKDKKIYVQAGAGIVYNSKPKMEYQECMNKAKSMIKALEKI